MTYVFTFKGTFCFLATYIWTKFTCVTEQFVLIKNNNLLLYVPTLLIRKPLTASQISGVLRQFICLSGSWRMSSVYSAFFLSNLVPTLPKMQLKWVTSHKGVLLVQLITCNIKLYIMFTYLCKLTLKCKISGV